MPSQNNDLALLVMKYLFDNQLGGSVRQSVTFVYEALTVNVLARYDALCPRFLNVLLTRCLITFEFLRVGNTVRREHVCREKFVFCVGTSYERHEG